MSQDSGGFKDVREDLDGHPIRSLLEYALPYWPRLGIGILASFLTRFARLVPPIVVATAIDRVILQSGDPGLLSDIGLLSPASISREPARIAILEQLVIIAIIAYLIRSATRFASRYLLQSTAQKVQRDLRDDTYDHIQHLSMDFFVSHQTGGMMSILNSDINRLEQFLNTEFRQMIRVIATVGGISIVLWTYSPKLALIALTPVPVIGVASWLFLRWIEPRYKSIRETVARLNTRLENNIGGTAVIKSFNRYGFERDRVAEHSQQYHDEKVAALRIRRGFFAALRLTTGIVFVLALYLGGTDIIAGQSDALSAGAFALFFLYLRRLYSPMRRIGKSANKYQLAKSSAERVFGILGKDPTIQTPAETIKPADVEGTVEFDDVVFSYRDRDPVLHNISLTVQAGTTIGLAGATGAGKSTLLKLLPRFYDTDEGTVRVDNVDVRQYDIERLRDAIAIVEQNPYLFSGTVAENIAYGDNEILDAEWHNDTTQSGTRSQIVEAAKSAEADEFISDLPNGYDTLIGERGIKLSGGQRQRLAIARAILNDPEIIIFDEATSDVDTETEELIQSSLNRLIEDRTAFIIAHRLSTIQTADRIVVLDDGEIIESGTHDRLLAEDGAYAALWESQADIGNTLRPAE